MTVKRRKTPPPRGTGITELRSRLAVAEETLHAIREGDVDAVVGARGEHVITLAGAELAYRILFEQMNEGAVTLTGDGIIAYCNGRLAEMVRTPLARIIGAPLRRFVPAADREAFDALVKAGHRASRRGDLTFRARGSVTIPVSVSFAPLQLGGKGRVIGVIGVVTDISDRERADANRNRLIHQAMTAQEEERRRIARELHDEAGQSLTALLVGLRTIQDSATIGEAAGLAMRLRAVAAQTLEDVGRLSRGLHSSALDDLGLIAAVQRYAQEFGELHDVAVEVRTDGLDAKGLPAPLQGTLYRALQEALTNVAKHAGARQVRVSLVRTVAAVELRVQDDGRGFDPARADGKDDARRSLGLQAMRERAALLGGSLQVSSVPGEGATVTARFPVAR